MNGVVWVEGPSDRILIKAWLDLLDPKLTENLDYAFAFFGGSCLAAFTFDDPELAELDQDVPGETEKEINSFIEVIRINPNVVVVMDRDSPEGEQPKKKAVRRVLKELKDEKVWVTKGREIENYVSLERLRSVLDEREGVDDLTFGPSDDIEKQLKVVKRFPKRYPKVEYAEKFSAAMSDSDLDVLDLRARITILSAAIRSWNHMPPLAPARANS